MANINAYLLFPGNTKEAMNFYKDSFGGELLLNTVKDTPMAAQMPPEMHNLVMHAYLKNDDLVIMGSDMQRESLQQGNNIKLAINCSSEKELNDIFNKLSAGGKTVQAPKQEFWGIYGEVIDQYNIAWMLNHDNKSNK